MAFLNGKIMVVSIFSGLDYWTGILDWTTGLNFYLADEDFTVLHIELMHDARGIYSNIDSLYHNLQPYSKYKSRRQHQSRSHA